MATLLGVRTLVASAEERTTRVSPPPAPPPLPPPLPPRAAAASELRTLLSAPPAPPPFPKALSLAESADLRLAAEALERTIFPGLVAEDEPDFERSPKRLRVPLSDFLLIDEGARTPRRIRFRLAEDPERAATLVFSPEPEADFRTAGSIFAPPPPPPPPPAPSRELGLPAADDAENLTTPPLKPAEEPREIVLLLPQGGDTARRTVRLGPEPERPLPILELALERLLVEGREKVRLLLEALGVLTSGVFTVGVRVVRDELPKRLGEL